MWFKYQHLQNHDLPLAFRRKPVELMKERPEVLRFRKIVAAVLDEKHFKTHGNFPQTTRYRFYRGDSPANTEEGWTRGFLTRQKGCYFRKCEFVLWRSGVAPEECKDLKGFLCFGNSRMRDVSRFTPHYHLTWIIPSEGSTPRCVVFCFPVGLIKGLGHRWRQEFE